METNEQEITEVLKYVKNIPEISMEYFTINDLNGIFSRKQSLRLAVVMLVKNQEMRIREVLEKLHCLNVIDEFVVVDTGSTDSTVSILNDLDYVSLYHKVWTNDFAYMRNEAAKYTKADWIMTIDSDELFLTENVDLKLLLAILENRVTDAFSIEFEQHYPERSDYGFPERIYSPKKAYYFGKVHEELRSNETRLPILKIPTKIKIKNEGVLPEENEKFSKAQNYNKLLLEMISIEPDNPRWVSFLILGDLVGIISLKEYEELLIKHLFKNQQVVLEKNDVKMHAYTSILLERYSSFLLVKKAYKDAQKFIKFALSIDENNTYLLFFQAFAQIEMIRFTSKIYLRDLLHDYLTLDYADSYDKNHQDNQLLKVEIAMLNYLSGNTDLSEKIMSEISDIRAKHFGKIWHLFKEEEEKNDL